MVEEAFGAFAVGWLGVAGAGEDFLELAELFFAAGEVADGVGDVAGDASGADAFEVGGDVVGDADGDPLRHTGRVAASYFAWVGVIRFSVGVGSWENWGVTGVRELAGVRVWFVGAEGPVLGDEAALLDLIGASWGLEVSWVVVPVERLGPEFFRLRSGVAGAVVQKFANYRLGLVVLGDVVGFVAASEALGDFVRESNRGRQLWFVPDDSALEAKLAALR